MDDLTNRIMTVGVAFLWIFLILVVILLAWGAPDQSIERLNDLAGYLDDHNNTSAKLIITFGGLVLILLATIVIIFEVAPPEGGSLKVQTGTGDARISTEEVVLRLEEVLRTMPNLAEVQAKVQSRGEKADVTLTLHVAADADLASMSEEACRRARALLEERMGVVLVRPPQAELHYRELQVGHQAPTAAQPQPVLSRAEEPAVTNPQPSTEASHDNPEPSPEDRPAGA